ncbi:MAG: HINT domain-containing protein [Lachnospiraceae bacterium]|nr:HINT domain-containing protein [Lachnospiraceae bacterium]
MCKIGYRGGCKKTAKEGAVKGITDCGNVVKCFTAGTKVSTTDGQKNIEEIKEGDHVISAEGTEAEVTFVETVKVEPTTTYNFEVEDWHTYFVSDAEVWVHNSSGKCDDVVEEAAEKTKVIWCNKPHTNGTQGHLESNC